MNNDVYQQIYHSYVTVHTREQLEINLKSINYGVVKLFPKDRSISVLDLGCGSGKFLLTLAAMGYKNLEGVDLSDEQISLARSRGLRRVHLGDATQFLKDHINKYDVITANDFLEHLGKSEVVEVLQLVTKALKPGGSFLAQTPNGSSPLFGGYFYGDFTHRTAFNSSSIRQICSISGFEMVEFVAVPPQIRSIKGLARRTLWTAAMFPIKVVLAAETGRLRGHIVTSNIVFKASI